MKPFAIFLLVWVVATFCGFMASMSMHGDWILMRQDARCAAYDPGSTQTVGTWEVSEDGRCHMSNFIVKRLLGLQWRN